jgi:hypothetical protein
MIRFALKCPDGHQFDSWFGSSADFDRLSASDLLSCGVCGRSGVEKAPMAPQVRASRNDDGAAQQPLSAPASPAELALRELRRRIEAQSENVGRRLVEEARAIHSGEAPERPIHGQARPADARALIEEGIPLVPLPWGDRQAN